MLILGTGPDGKASDSGPVALYAFPGGILRMIDCVACKAQRKVFTLLDVDTWSGIAQCSVCGWKCRLVQGRFHSEINGGQSPCNTDA